MMGIFWKDRIDEFDQWNGLEVSVPQSYTPIFTLQSGGKLRFRLTDNKESLFWGCIESDYYGVWFLRNSRINTLKDVFIPPITSSDIQKSILDQQNKNSRYWAKYFIEALSKSQRSFLREGKWMISEADQKRVDRGTISKELFWSVKGLSQTFKLETIDVIQWDINSTSVLIPIKDKPQPEEGRLKWWRKQVKEGVCPPIFVWYLNVLDAYVIIDGHCRLQAFLDEDVFPKILVLNEVRLRPYQLDQEVKGNLLSGVDYINKKQNIEDGKKVEKMNKLLIRAYDNRPWIYPITKSLFQSNIEEDWIREVKANASEFNLDLKDVEFMIKNE